MCLPEAHGILCLLEYLSTIESIFGAQNEDDSVEGIFKRLRVRSKLIVCMEKLTT